MVFPWFHHGLLWFHHGLSVVPPWYNHGLFMVSSWIYYDVVYIRNGKAVDAFKRLVDIHISIVFL
jgi:hypothetical protein